MALAEDVIRRAQARLGTVVGNKWRLERVLGIGGMATVYAAQHRNQNRVALKMLHPEQSIDSVVRSRFLREGYVGNSVEHPGVVRVMDDNITDDGAAFLVMELLEGESLEDRRERYGDRLPVAEVLALADQLLDVLRAAHDKGVVHRDLKPENLFLTLRGELKVLDFGIAHLRELSEASGSTGVGTFMGTPSYMPPEQARARWDEVDARSDLWAVGAVMFTLLAGRTVHQAATVPEQLVLAVQQPAPLLGLLCPDSPPQVCDLVDKALSFDKVQRWQDAHAMQLAVRDAIKVVGRPETLSVAARAESGERPRMADADTMLASSAKPRVGSVSGISASPGTLLSGEKELRRTRSPMLWLLIAPVLLLVATLLWQQRDVATREAALAAPVDSLEPVTSVAAQVVQAAPAVSPALQAEPPAAPSALIPAPPSARPSALPKAAKTKPAAPAKPRTPSEKPPSGGDPFDKRF